MATVSQSKVEVKDALLSVKSKATTFRELARTPGPSPTGATPITLLITSGRSFSPVS